MPLSVHSSARVAPIHERLPSLLTALGEGLYERQDALRLGLLAALSGESVFLLGPPGIAKSLIARRLKLAFFDARHFEYLMTRFSTPEEVFGPLSIQALKEEGKYLRLTAGYLPQAEVVFLDEIWKAGPAILNTLLTAINERQFRNGDETLPIPMRLLISASNELPAPDSGLEALYDRMLVRIWMDRVQEKSNFQAMLASDGANPRQLTASLQIHNEEYQSWQHQIEQVTLPDEVFELIYRLRQRLDHLGDEPCYVSDRRWKKAVRLCKASAFFHGRSEVAPLDLLLLKDCLWHNGESRAALLTLMEEFARLHCYQQQTLISRHLAITSALQELQLQMSARLALKAEPGKGMLGKRGKGWRLPLDEADKQGERGLQIQLHLLAPARLSPEEPDLLVQTLECDKVVLGHWQQGDQVLFHPVGSKTGLTLELELDGEQRLHLLDSQRHPIPLVLVRRAPLPGLVSEPWYKAIASLNEQLMALRTDLRRQRQRFDGHQPHHFLDSRWLVIVEEGFFTLTRELEQTAEQLAQWQRRLPLLCGEQG
ncbi:ATPase RavA domain-containing protein [Aeromonas bivalvium]|uniref:ATPase RavA domain-containing protein n=1 Tax=Aeromonas bivalvium TaxID=440079 RepID=UPI0005A720E9|nr:ATPase RavA domain-containing protein [Aeromonas bivalvium]